MPEPIGETSAGGDVVCNLSQVMDSRGMSMQELSKRTGITRANLSVLKNNRAKAVRFSTVVALCAALDCEIADLFVVERG